MSVHTGAEAIQGRKLFKGGNYSRKYGKQNIYAKALNVMYTELAAPGWSVKKQSVYKPLYLFDGVLLAETCYCLQLYSNQVGFFNKCFFNNCFFTA